jgi:peptidoglycan/LPS O-acetylase OafA/YrhL
MDMWKRDRQAAPRSVAIDSLRALAALAVLGIHVGHCSGVNVNAAYGAFTSHLNVGVTLFFLISGFLLYRPWAASLLRGTPSPALGSYARRRFLRIVPAYWVALTALALWPGLEGVFSSDWWVYYGFAQSYRVDWSFRGLAQAWSLSVEAHYYLLLPLYGAGIAALAHGRSAAARLAIASAGLAALAAVGLACTYELARRMSLYWSPSLPAHLLWFAVGMGLALASVRLEGREHESRVARFVIDHPTACWALAAALYAGLCLTPGIPRAMEPEAYTAPEKLAEHVVYAAVSLLMMLPAVFGAGAGGLARRALESRALAAAGVVSYGVFLWHLPLLFAMRERGVAGWIPGWPFLSLAAAILPAALLCGAASWFAIERPLIRASRR